MVLMRLFVFLNEMYLMKIVKASLWLCNLSYHLTVSYFISNFKLMGNKKDQREAP